MKIVFLDIDGVLNSEKFRTSWRCARKINNGMKFPDTHLDTVAIRMVNYLCRITESKIVISSTWREFSDCMPALARNHLDMHLVQDKTPVIKDNARRGAEIQAWLDENEYKNYVIIDDDTDILESQQDHFIHVNSKTGFTTKDLSKAISILNDEKELNYDS